MPTLFIGKHKIELPSVDSTNNFAANLLKTTNVLEGTVILSENQTGGRGQAGNTWQSATGDNLTISYILYPDFLPVNQQFYLSMITSLAVQSTLEVVGIKAKIKWPNDVMAGSRKISGILIENGISGKVISHTILGIGLNVNQTSFQPPLNSTATSMANVTGQFQVKEQVLSQLNLQLEKYYLDLRSGKFDQIKEKYLGNLLGFQEWLNYVDIASGENFKGSIQDVATDGRILIETQSIPRTYTFKEVKLIG